MGPGRPELWLPAEPPPPVVVAPGDVVVVVDEVAPSVGDVVVVVDEDVPVGAVVLVVDEVSAPGVQGAAGLLSMGAPPLGRMALRDSTAGTVPSFWMKCRSPGLRIQAR